MDMSAQNRHSRPVRFLRWGAGLVLGAILLFSPSILRFGDGPSRQPLALPTVIDTIPPGTRPVRTDIQLPSQTPIDAIEPITDRIDLIALRKRAVTADTGRVRDDRFFDRYGRRDSAASRLALLARNPQLSASVIVDPEARMAGHPPGGWWSIPTWDPATFGGRHGADTTLRSASVLPLFIINRSDSILWLGSQDGALPVILEARDTDGVWKPIEYWEFSDCGNSYQDFYLRPGELVLSHVWRYEGPFATELRARILFGNGVVTSEPFRGSIDRRQFDRVDMHHDNGYFERAL